MDLIFIHIFIHAHIVHMHNKSQNFIGIHVHAYRGGIKQRLPDQIQTLPEQPEISQIWSVLLHEAQSEEKS